MDESKRSPLTPNRGRQEGPGGNEQETEANQKDIEPYIQGKTQFNDDFLLACHRS